MAKIGILVCALILIGCDQEPSIEIVAYDPTLDYFEDTEGNRVPKDRHIGWPIEAKGIVGDIEFPLDESGRITDRLKSNGVEIEFVKFYGNNYMVWSKKDDDCVKKIIDNNGWCEKESNKRPKKSSAKNMAPPLGRVLGLQLFYCA